MKSALEFRNPGRHTARLCATLASISAGTVALGQDAPAGANTAPVSQLQEVVVTATKAGATAAQKTPLAITALSATDVDRLLINNVRDLASLTPNMAIAQNTGYAQIYIRGIGSNNVFNGSDPSSTINVDGVYIARPFSQFANFLDVERVEILRGPQGTLYGRNSIGGTINVISRQPTDTPDAKIQLTGGNYGLLQGEAYLSGPIVPGKVQASLSGSYANHDDYFKNIVAGTPGLGNEDVRSLRGQLRVQVTDGIDATTRADWSSEDDRVVGYSKLLLPYNAMTNSILGDFSRIAQNTRTHTLVRAKGVSEDVFAALSDNVKLRSITAYRENNFSDRLDTDASNVDTTVSNLQEDQHQFSQELNLSGRWERLQYIAGAYFIHEVDQTNNLIEYHALGRLLASHPGTTADAWALYTQFDYHLTDKLTATAGVRYTDERKRIDQDITFTLTSSGAPITGFPSSYSTSREFRSTTPKFGIEYQLDANKLLYVSATKGFKSGGFNVSSTDPNQGFEPEEVWSYEVGSKNDFFEHRVRANLTGFYYDYTNLQVSAFSRPGFVDITNAATATVKGIELEAAWMPIADLQLAASGSVLSARYDRYIASTGDVSGNYLNSAPRHTAHVSAQYDWHLARAVWSLRGEYALTGEQFFTPQNTLINSQGSYRLLNASVSYAPVAATWRVELWGKNLTDEQYVTTTASYPAVIAGRPGDPRIFGVRLTWTN
jgi:iron complex outermembrane receptor protein